MRLRKINFFLTSFLLLLVASIFLLSCLRCGGLKKEDKSLKQSPSTATIAENLEKSQNVENQKTAKNPKLILQDSFLILKGDNNIIFKKELSKINPYLINLDLNYTDFDNISGLYLLGDNVTKDRFRSFLSSSFLNSVPSSYTSSYASIRSPIIATNDIDKFAASFIFEWGDGLLNENSQGEYQYSSILIWNEKGQLLEKMNLDFGAQPYITKNGQYMWLKYGEFPKGSSRNTKDLIPGMSLYDIDKKRVVFKQVFPDNEIIVGGYNNSLDYFGFTVFISKTHYKIYYLDEANSVLYSKEIKPDTNIDNLTIENDFDKINLQ